MAATTKPETVTTPTAIRIQFAAGPRHFGNKGQSMMANPMGIREKTIAIASDSSNIVNSTLD
jgi:hypothetical protein